MRVTPRQIDTVRSFAKHHFGDYAEVWLFGSRVDDSKRGAIMIFSFKLHLTSVMQLLNASLR